MAEDTQRRGLCSIPVLIACVLVATVGVFIGVQYSGKNVQEIVVTVQDKLRDYGVPIGQQAAEEKMEHKTYQQQETPKEHRKDETTTTSRATGEKKATAGTRKETAARGRGKKTKNLARRARKA
ncbi:hypothetical protein OESDEN_02462 [Oesophagostomum dentatum]|uniref:Uncharacterized protein n=1 Tax=Oesophagostomum dentatum TaxID=61180 RepID=A0A0B1TQ94_OESDE|nr:hypothetical protein OESDEN_02462 [Oesophagostomum dentatum]